MKGPGARRTEAKEGQPIIEQFKQVLSKVGASDMAKRLRKLSIQNNINQYQFKTDPVSVPQYNV